MTFQVVISIQKDRGSVGAWVSLRSGPGLGRPERGLGRQRDSGETVPKSFQKTTPQKRVEGNDEKYEVYAII